MATGGEQHNTKDIQNLYKEYVTPLLKILLLQRVKQLKEPNQLEEEWTVNLFLHKNKKTILNFILNKNLEDVLYPYQEPTNLDKWDFTAYVLVLQTACNLNERLQEDLNNLEELANKIQIYQNNNLSEGIYYAYQDRIRCRITQICKSLENGGNGHDILSRFEEFCPLISRSKNPNGFAQKFEKDVQVVSQRDSDAISYLEWIEHRLKKVKTNPLIPEIEVVVILRHYNQCDEQRVSRYIETAFIEAAQKYDVSSSQDEKEFNLYQEEASFFESEDVKEKIQFFVKKLFEGQQRITSVTTGCVKLKIQCETIRAVIDLLEQSINGLLTFDLVTLEEKIRLIHGHDIFDIYVGVTRESCWTLVNELKTVAFRGYKLEKLHETLTINHRRIEDGQKIIIKSRPTTVTSVQDLRCIVSSEERMQTCRQLGELLTRQLPSSEGTINMSVKVIPDNDVISKYDPDSLRRKKTEHISESRSNMATKELADTNTSNDSTTAEGEYKTKLVDQEEQWKSCLDGIKQAISKDNMLALYCEGDNLSRKGEMQFLTVATREKAYFLDIQKLKMLPFEHGLREILEDKNVMKLMFDCREDADALFHQFHVKLDGVLDIQLLEIMKRPQFKRHGINRKRGNHTIDAIYLNSISECMTEYIKSDKMTKGRRKGVGRESKLANQPQTVDQIKMKYSKIKVFSLFCLFDHFKPVGEGMKRLNIASQIYVDLKRSILSREYNEFENNRYLPVDVIPDKGSVSFPVGDISCKTCHRRFPGAEFSKTQLKTNNQMCRTCKKVKNDNDVYQNRLNQLGEYGSTKDDFTTKDSTTNDFTTDDFTTNDSTTDDFSTDDSTTGDFSTDDDIDGFDYYDHIDALSEDFYFIHESPW